jgi:soluble lytic murein transglycosylase-like protein
LRTSSSAAAFGFPPIEARQGIILGKSGKPAGLRAKMPGFGHIRARRLQQSGGLSVGNRAHRAPTEAALMKSAVSLAWLIAVAAVPFSQAASARDAQYDALVATHAKANNLPEALVHRVIVRESGYRPHLVSRGNIGLMQIKLGTARGLGYTGTAEGLRDPNTNLTWAVKYLAGAWRVANGDHRRAMHYYASGYYHAAKQHRHHSSPPRLEELTSANAQQVAK